MTRTGSRLLGRDDVVPAHPVARSTAARSTAAGTAAVRTAPTGAAGGGDGSATVRVPAPTVADLTSLGALLLFDRRTVRGGAPTTAGRQRSRTLSG